MSAGTQQLDLFEDLSYYEGADIEYKSARGGLPSSLWETYSAFANTAGGTLWLGISQGNDGQLRLQGLENPEKLKGDVHNLLNNREKVSRNLLTDADVEIVRVPEDGRALTSGVPRDSGLATPDSTVLTPDSAALTPDSGSETPDLAALTPDSGSVSPDSAEEWGELLQRAKPVRERGAAPRELVRSTLLALCSERFLSLRELADLLNRNPEALRNEYVTKMVKAGQLELLHPDQPRHRQQAYRSAAGAEEDGT